jgi:hypothetical protein
VHRNHREFTAENAETAEKKIRHGLTRIHTVFATKLLVFIRHSII